MMRKGRTHRRRAKSRQNRRDPSVLKLDSRPEFIQILKWIHNLCTTAQTPFEKGSISPTEFSTGPCSYRGVAACKPIPNQSTILYLPENVLITLSTFEHSLRNLFGCEEFERLSIHEKFVVFLLLELRQDDGESSDFLPYLRTLPSAEDFASHPIHLTEPSYQDIFNRLPLEIRQCLQEQRAGIESGFFKVKAVLASRTEDGLVYSYFEWLWLIVNTRTVFYRRTTPGEKEMALAPFLDLINHSPQQNTVVEFVEGNGHCGRGYLIRARQDIEANSQIFISYGPHPNYKLWVDYGFLPVESNPEDFIPIDFHYLVDNLAPMSSLKRDGRKVAVIEKYCLDQELNLLGGGDVSANLVLLVGISQWDPEVDGTHFQFQTDLEKDPRLKGGILGLIQFKLEEYLDSLNAVMAEVNRKDSAVLKVAESYLSKSIQLLSELKLGFEQVGILSSIDSLGSSLPDVFSSRTHIPCEGGDQIA